MNEKNIKSNDKVNQFILNMVGGNLYNFFIVIIILFFITGCSIKEPDRNSVAPFTESNPDALLAEEELNKPGTEDEPNNATDEGGNEDPIPLEQINLNEEIKEEHEFPQHEQDSLQQMIPEEQELSDSSSISTHLPFFDVKERWNAISDEQFSNLYINSLERGTEEGHYHTILGSNLELHIYVQEDYIQRLEMISKDKTNKTNQQMLTGWNQIINIVHPNIEIYDVDSLFHKIGVGPNSDLSKVSYTRFTYSHISYEVQPTSTGYTFRVFYNSN